MPLAYLWRRGLTLDDAARIATDAGYDCRDDTWRLISMIRDELFGFARHVAAQDAAIDLELDEWQRAHEIIMSDDCPF